MTMLFKIMNNLTLPIRDMLTSRNMKQREKENSQIWSENCKLP